MKERPRDRLRKLLFFTPWVSIPLAVLGASLSLATPLVLLTSLGWICYPVALGLAVALALWLRPKYRVAILDSSHLGVFYWLQKRS
jgi:hypothetical protein